ncbi:putative beta-lysine N-acetyltransferase [Methanomicrobium sp. W14]|uniref:putative beta-lysine N-acetyltransferase n=1 Tax=Methanomicrobium sp. W14 TaxID=2817839 RepID=UPI001AE45546|nr:putative beta-lysine N-acetyltransferase [Methanomicrobium sp. W14]MBP2133514.1 putative beta-lysine N-acetyltransferase [Methanomicrobium sp. W14]
MIRDEICTILNSVVQHGDYNDRVYLMKLSDSDYPGIIKLIDKLAEEKGYSKSFAKVPEHMREGFLSDGYIQEGIIPGMYRGFCDGCFLSKYYNTVRGIPKGKIIGQKDLESSEGKFTESSVSSGMKDQKNNLSDGFTARRADEKDSGLLADLFSKVFESYPFPVDSPEYIRKTMDFGTVYFGVQSEETKEFVAASSAETDIDSLSAEMTDFATDPAFRGKGFAGFLLFLMEEEMKKRGITMSYTIARASFLPVNRLFYDRCYRFAGTLVNNTNICGSFESMNLWYKKL